MREDSYVNAVFTLETKPTPIYPARYSVFDWSLTFDSDAGPDWKVHIRGEAYIAPVGDHYGPIDQSCMLLKDAKRCIFVSATGGVEIQLCGEPASGDQQTSKAVLEIKQRNLTGIEQLTDCRQ